MGRVT